ncbi:twin-arginine translocation signal domain-containing protein [Bradyrhizobium uaiense]|uniref:Twin-arginine translocation signal domain-containing protein n=1 Tax=Bradyrhizobium uaiense TaxID=2594946 RepID=A0A6P1BJG2_9BRAD|nr:twin-arginine translocation signal domain-containing protein [Bradyrhizobium uaiense]NEU98676.1 twin-arginine translocation signal domain-containing protein [Bradyrhizobium uaiense]
MSKRSSSRRDGAPDSSRRNFLKGATIAGAAALGTPAAANTAMSAFPEQRSKAALPGPRLAAADAMPPPADPVNHQTSSGGDFMVDVLKTLDIELPRDELRLELPRAARGRHQSWRQQEARDHHLSA